MEPMEPVVWVFFYGSYINRDVLAEVDIAPADWAVATLAGFDLVIAPRANLVRRSTSVVWGVLATATHAELDRLYRDHAQGVLGETYLPEAIVATDETGRLRPAMTYIAPAMIDRPADRAYVERIAGPAERLGFPDWYIRKIRNFAPAG
jgi:hypothetical protein